MTKSEKTICISNELYNLIVDQCYHALPYECCGLLSGDIEGKVNSIWPLKNEAKIKKQFHVSHETVREALRNIEAKGERVMILYHSHPTAPPIPSHEDLRYHPDMNIRMLIFSLMNGIVEYKCYKVSGMKYTEVPVEILTVDS